MKLTTISTFLTLAFSSSLLRAEPPVVTSLFNGKDLTGWHADIPKADEKEDIEPSFIVRDGNLVSLGTPGGHLITNEEFENYRLEVEYRFSAKPGNCGVLVHSSTPRALFKMFPASIEVQLQHQNAGDFWCIKENIVVPEMEERRPRKNSEQKYGGSQGDARRIQKLEESAEKEAGEWNTMIIECLAAEVKVWVNGQLMNHGSEATATKGQIALQAEGSEVEFRKLALTPISALTK